MKIGLLFFYSELTEDYIVFDIIGGSFYFIR